MFFAKLKNGALGSKCPITSWEERPATAQGVLEGRKGGVLFKPIVPINTYRMHKTLFDIAKDEIVASAVLG